jgi:predicted Zn-dependent protease
LGATRELLLPLTVLGCFAVYYLAEQPFWVVVVCAAPMLLLYALAPLWAARSLASFDRDAVRLLAARRPDALRRRYARALGLRLFAIPALRAERKALVYAECGDAATAREAYREALEEHQGGAPPLRVMVGFAHASFQLGDDARAIGMYRKILAGAPALPGVERNLAHAMVRCGEELDEAIAMLGRLEHEPQTKLLLAWAYAKQGDRARAAELLAALPDSELGELRAEVRRVLDEA